MSYYKILFAIALVSFSTILTAQNTSSNPVDTAMLRTQVDGPLTLLWDIIDNQYVFYSKKGNDIQALVNTKEDGTYQEQYKEVLRKQTEGSGLSVDKVKLTIPSLTKFFNAYNLQVDPSYEAVSNKVGIALRLGGFFGVTNSHFTSNPTNAYQPTFGAELEVTGTESLIQHALVLRAAQTFEVSDYIYNATQASLNYRYKVIQKPTFDIYGNVKFATYTNFNAEQEVVIDNSEGTTTELRKTDGSNFQVSGIFGIGADIALGKGYITLFYDDIVGVDVTSNGEFPVNFMVGYKIRL